MSNIPRARKMLIRTIRQLLSGQHNPNECVIFLRSALVDMQRAKPVRRVDNRSVPITREMAIDIRNYERVHPLLTMQEIAAIFGTNSGRVSEALNHKR